jgi:hypothetical protein
LLFEDTSKQSPHLDFVIDDEDRRRMDLCAHVSSTEGAGEPMGRRFMNCAPPPERGA